MNKIIQKNLQRAQKNLTTLYDLELNADIYDYLVDEERARQAIDWDEFYNQLSFEKLIKESDDPEITINGCVIIDEKSNNELRDYKGIGLGLYYDEDIISCIEKYDPHECISSSNFSQYQTLLEEASHIIYTMQSIKYKTPFTQLEQELQAHVDKFILTIFNAGRLNKGGIPKNYIDYFTDDNVDLLSYMTDEFKETHSAAARYGAKYCSYLYESHLKHFDSKRFKHEVNDFYRRTQNGKIGRLNEIHKPEEKRKIPRIKINDAQINL